MHDLCVNAIPAQQTPSTQIGLHTVIISLYSIIHLETVESTSRLWIQCNTLGEVGGPTTMYTRLS